MKRFLIITVAVFTVIACSNTSTVKHDYSSNQFDISHVKSNLEFLASDHLRGRDAASQSEKVASQFIAGELQKYGLEPFGDDGTYFQNITFSSRKLNEDSHITIYNGDSSTTLLKLGDDVATQAYRVFNPEYLNKRLPIVFAGFGIAAEEFGYDDYSYVDPTDKIVIIMPGEPYSESEEFFNGKERSKYSSAFTKAKIAEDKGAAGILIIPSDEYLAYWDMIVKRSTSASLQLPNDESETGIPTAMISHDALRKLLEGEEYTFDKIQSVIKDKDIPEAFELVKEASISFNTFSEEKQGRNVLALLPGTDKNLAEEFITIGAHYDHVGITDGEIYNGADDNGSGTTSVLEAARILSAAKNNKRPIMFLFYTAEEKGLLGSKYFIKNYNMDNIITNINVDMTGRGSIDTIYCIGSDRESSEFDSIINESNSESVNYFLDYSLSHTRLFRQSDHYTYAKEGVPVVFFFDNMRRDLHKPGDDVEKINFPKISKTAHLVSKIASKVANLEHRLKLDK